MEEAEIIFYFDYVDPACWLLDQALRALAPAGLEPVRPAGPKPVRPVGPKLARPAGVKLVRRPFELRPPPLPPIDPESEAWRARCDGVRAGARDHGLRVPMPRRMPWSRKAHELFLHARAKGCCEAVHAALFRAFFEKKADIGRVDVLVALAGEQGLDASEARAVLDVDRYAAEVGEMRDAALREGVRAPPTLEMDGRRLEGLPDRRSLVRFLRMAASG